MKIKHLLSIITFALVAGLSIPTTAMCMDNDNTKEVQQDKENIDASIVLAIPRAFGGVFHGAIDFMESVIALPFTFTWGLIKITITELASIISSTLKLTGRALKLLVYISIFITIVYGADFGLEFLTTLGLLPDSILGYSLGTISGFISDNFKIHIIDTVIPFLTSEDGLRTLVNTLGTKTSSFFVSFWEKLPDFSDNHFQNCITEQMPEIDKCWTANCVKKILSQCAENAK